MSSLIYIYLPCVIVFLNTAKAPGNQNNFTTLTDDFVCALMQFRDVEAVKFLMLLLPAPPEVLCFQVCFRFLTFGIFCFRFQPLLSKCFYLHKNLTASTSLLSVKQLIVFSVKKQAGLLYKQFYLTCVVDRACIVWDGRRFFHIPYWQFSIPC